MEDGTLVTVKVLLFAKARELSGTKFGSLKIKATTSYDCLLSEVVNNFSLEQIRNNILLAVNEELRDPKSEICLKEGDEVAVIPPISGELTDEKLSLEEISGLVTKSSCGAVSFFVGTTRENFEDKKVIHLEYEAYKPMAVTAIKKICEEIRSQWKVENIAVYHRLGVVPVKEASVVIAVSSVHRSDSLQAVQYGIDTLKASVPIWKKEVYEMSPPEWKENQECSWKH